MQESTDEYLCRDSDGVSVQPLPTRQGLLKPEILGQTAGNSCRCIVDAGLKPVSDGELSVDAASVVGLCSHAIKLCALHESDNGPLGIAVDVDDPGLGACGV